MRALMCSVFILAATQAWAGVSNTERHPASATIPCAGTLDETYTEGGNMFGVFSALTLVCQGSNKIEWVLEASVGCNTGDTEMGDRCDTPLAQPIGRFHSDKSNDSTHIYELARYVFAKSCASIPVTTRQMEAKTNRVWTTTTESELVCTQISAVDGTVGENFAEVAPAAYKYVRVTTTGETEKMADGPGPRIANAPDRTANYALTLRDGKMQKD